MTARRRAARLIALVTGAFCLSGESTRPAPQRAGTVTVGTFWSQALGVRKQYVVYLPASYASSAGRRYPVAYYLHGVSGDEWNWARLGALPVAMDSLVAAGAPEMIVVMPDGDDSWYTTWNLLGNNAACQRDTTRSEPANTYCVPWPHYDDYIAHDLVAHVDSAFRTLADRAHRGIGGLSMGGYGAVSLALEYPEVYSAAASHSGVLSPLYTDPHPYGGAPQHATEMHALSSQWRFLWRSMGPAFGPDTVGWHARDPARRAALLSATVHAGAARFPALFFDCGTNDAVFIDENRDFDAALTTLGVAHMYREWPGTHSWDYWRAHVGESLAWMAGQLGSRR